MRYSIFLLTLFLAACGQPDAPEPEESTATSERPTVYAVNYPLAWAAAQLAGDSADVQFPAPANVDPAFWEPDLETVAAIQQADLILLNGANYAKWTARVSLPQNRLLDTSSDFSSAYIEVNSGPVHSHGPSGEHSHGELAFTLWLDLSIFTGQANTITEALTKLLPAHKEDIQFRWTQLEAMLTEFDESLISAGEKLAGRPVLFSHPVYQYLERRYGINGRSLHWEPGLVPTAQDWNELDALLIEHAATLMLWEAEPLPATRAELAHRGIEVVVFEPVGNTPSDGDFADTMAKNISRLSVVSSTHDPDAA